MFENPVINMGVTCIILIIVWVISFIVILKLKKMFTIGTKSNNSFEGMSMERLENIHDSGMISDDEFAKMRRALLGLPPADGEKSKKIPPSGDSFDIMKNSDKTDNNDGSENND